MLFFSCQNNSPKGKFTVTGELKNAQDQNIYLEELSQGSPLILDTAKLVNGKFTISATSPGEGLYRLRLENNNTGFYFINDTPLINFSADLQNLNLATILFQSRANAILRDFLISIERQRNIIGTADVQLDSLKNNKAPDSLIQAATQKINTITKTYNDFLLHFIDTISDPVVAVFSIDYAGRMNPNDLLIPVSNLAKKFPNNPMILAAIKNFGQVVTQYNASPHIGNMAPELNLPDTSGQPFALSSLRGKYVLVDFWASWCAPCRAENPFVVKVFNKYNDKNFTVLSVSLDNNVQEWKNAIALDKLSWKQVSDLQGWNSIAVSLYKFDAIPYNVLLDPQGRIIATNLLDEDLEKKMETIFGKN
jgi:thiol-disulfide isomerase/thioredoxin